MVTSGVGRLATWVAVGALVVNALLLGAAGLVAGRPLLMGVAILLLVAALIVVAAWQRHLRTLADLSAERQALRDEALALRDLVRGRRE